MTAYDIIIVGGGIGGPALATVMARAGKSVLLLEQSETYEDRVRGEWISPWGTAETKRIGIYDTLIAAGGHHLKRHVSYHPGLSAAESEAHAIDLATFVDDVPGPLCIGHPHHCQTLFDAAIAAGADARKGVTVTEVVTGAEPRVGFTDKTGSHVATARLVVGADGRMSIVRKAAGIKLHRDAPHHWFAGLLVEGVHGWDEHTESSGTEGDFHFLGFPQGNGRVRIYGGYALNQAARFNGPEGPQRFIEAFAAMSAPTAQAVAKGRPAGPLMSYHNSDSWTDEPYAEGVVLIGDAAGWNDPIAGLGLSITYRDVRIVSEILLASDDWSPAAFAPYGEERGERMRRLRFAAAVQSRLEVEFGPEADEFREGFSRRAADEPFLRMFGLTILGGPDKVPAEYFTPETHARIMGVREAA